MKTIACGFAASLAFVVASLPADAASRKRRVVVSPDGYVVAGQPWRRSERSAVSSYGRVPYDMEGIRANAADPTGEFRNYPDWARSAFRDKRRS